MFFIFIHELTHLIFGLILGLKPKSINIYALGISLEFYSFGHIKYKKIKRILINLSGPAINFIIAIAFIILNKSEYEMIVYSNILLGFFNLLPVYPLDGGKILKEIISIKNSEKTAGLITNKVSNAVVICLTAIYSILILYVHNLAIVCMLIFLWINLIKENKKFKLKEKIYKIIENN